MNDVTTKARWMYSALFIATYATSFAWFHYAEKSTVLATHSVAQQLTGFAPAPIPVERRVITHSEPRLPNRAPPAPIEKPVTTIEPQQRDHPTPLGYASSDELSTLAALMVDTDPEVAKVARDAYQSKQAGLQ